MWLHFKQHASDRSVALDELVGVGGKFHGKRACDSHAELASQCPTHQACGGPDVSEVDR